MIESFAAVDVAMLAQMGPGSVPNPNLGGITSVLGSAVGAFLSTLVVGALLIGLVPEYTRRQMNEFVAEPLGSFLYGLASMLLLMVVVIVLLITIIGIIVAIPLALLVSVLWAVGAAIAFLALGDRLVGHDDGWTRPLLVGAAINGTLTLTGIGGLLTFGIGAAGFGTVIRSYLA